MPQKSLPASLFQREEICPSSFEKGGLRGISEFPGQIGIRRLRDLPHIFNKPKKLNNS
jgi:hypothetical protein